MRTFFRYIIFHVLEILRWPVISISKLFSLICVIGLIVGFATPLSTVMSISLKTMLVVYTFLATAIYVGYDYLLVFAHPVLTHKYRNRAW